MESVATLQVVFFLAAALLIQEFSLMAKDLPDTFFGKHYLPQLIPPGPETGGTDQKIVGPHPVKSLIIYFFDLIPVSGEVFKPGHQCSVVIRSETVPVFEMK